MKEQLFMKRFVAPQVLTVNGKPSPCNCNERIVCSYCVQANLILYDRYQNKGGGDDVSKAAIATIKKVGLRKSARLIGEYSNTVSRWIKSGNIPLNAVEKIAKLRT
jgi:hypothetical protein